MMERHRHGFHAWIQSLRALAPSLRQYELDQVQRVTAPQQAKPHCPAVSQPLAGPPWWIPTVV